MQSYTRQTRRTMLRAAVSPEIFIPRESITLPRTLRLLCPRCGDSRRCRRTFFSSSTFFLLSCFFFIFFFFENRTHLRRERGCKFESREKKKIRATAPQRTARATRIHMIICGGLKESHSSWPQPRRTFNQRSNTTRDEKCTAKWKKKLRLRGERRSQKAAVFKSHRSGRASLHTLRTSVGEVRCAGSGARATRRLRLVYCRHLQRRADSKDQRPGRVIQSLSAVRISRPCSFCIN